MTADVLMHPGAGAMADETVRRSIRALIEGRGVDKDEVARAVGMTRTTLYRRLGGSGSTQAFSAGEVAVIATFFRVPITSLFDGLGGAFIAQGDDVMNACSLSSRRHLTLLPRLADASPLFRQRHVS